MTATREGGLKTKAKLLAKDPNHYYNMGMKGAKVGKGSFADKTIGPDGLTNAQRWGAKGGAKSRRGKSVKKDKALDGDLS